MVAPVLDFIVEVVLAFRLGFAFGTRLGTGLDGVVIRRRTPSLSMT